MIDEPQKDISAWLCSKARQAKDCAAPLADGLEGLTGSFCYGGEPYTFNCSLIVRNVFRSNEFGGIYDEWFRSVIFEPKTVPSLSRE